MLALIPSDRIFRREWHGGEYSQLFYGEHEIRAKPAMWHVVVQPMFDVGDEVEIRSQMGKCRPGLSIVREVVWNRHTDSAQYELEQREMMLPRLFDDTNLSLVKFLHNTG